MARHEEKTEDAVRRAGEQAAEQPRRIGIAAAEAAEEVAKTSANLFQQNAELMRNTWRFGVDVASAMMGRSADQFGRTVGLSGSEAQQATERSARNAETILYSATAASKGLNGLSQEYFQLVRRQLETNMDRIGELWRCRTPHVEPPSGHHWLVPVMVPPARLARRDPGAARRPPRYAR